MMKFNRPRMASLALPGRMEISVQEHHKIIEAFKSHDGERADNLVRKTAAYGGQVLIQSLAKEEGRRVEKSVLRRSIDV
jgi:DNA-binding GntR family transcriptional regulator